MADQRYTPEQVIEALSQTGGTLYLAAKRLGCNVSTIHRYKQRYPDVAAACEQQRGEMVDTAELMLWKAIQNGEAWAICFTLKTQGKNRGYVERQEVRVTTDDDVNRAIEDELAFLAGRRPAAPAGETEAEEAGAGERPDALPG